MIQHIPTSDIKEMAETLNVCIEQSLDQERVIAELKAKLKEVLKPKAFANLLDTSLTEENDQLEAENKKLIDRVVLAEQLMSSLHHVAIRTGNSLFILDMLDPYRKKYPTALIGEIKLKESEWL